MIKVAIVDDNAAIADSLEEIIQSFADFSVEFKAVNGIDLLNKLKQSQPDVLIMDIQMPLMNGIEAVKAVREKYPTIKIVMHTVVSKDDQILESIMLGANGYLLKNEPPRKLLEAITDVVNGAAPITPSIAQKLIGYLNFSQTQVQTPAAYNLSEREAEILALISEGLSYKMVADKLFISVKTVGKHIENIYAKLHVNSKIEAVNLFRNFIRR